jgi:ABC-type enterochelin transport system substrate-binding protein
LKKIVKLVIVRDANLSGYIGSPLILPLKQRRDPKNKLLFFLSAVLLMVLLGACSNEEASKEEKSKEDAAAAETANESKEVRSALLSYQEEMTKVISNTEASITAEGQDAAEVAAAFEQDAKAVSFPEVLSDYASDIDASVDSLSQYYAKKAELLKGGSE